MRGGLTLLRETLDSIHSPTNLPIKLSDPTIQTQLRKARTTIPEWNCLYPSPGVYGKSTDFDITLTFRLLRTICNLTPPVTGWDGLPNSTDQCLEANLARVKYYRNEVYGHSKTMEIPDDRFEALWGEISEALLRIAANISHKKRDEWKESTDSFLHDPLTPDEERCVEELHQWYKNDMDVKDAVEKLEATIKKTNEKLQQEIQGLREEKDGDKIAMLQLNATQLSLREDVRQIKQLLGQYKVTFLFSESVCILKLQELLNSRISGLYVAHLIERPTWVWRDAGWGTKSRRDAGYEK